MRFARVKRKTKETDVLVEVDLDDKGYEIETTIPFFNHMLETLALHSEIKVTIKASGDLKHHIIEDVGIALGESIRKALGDKKGIKRFGSCIIPMDESVAICGIDISGRGIFNLDGEIKGYIEGVDAEVFQHFFETLCRTSGINAYIQVKGKNLHHMIEAIFKAFAKSFKDAIKIEGEEVRSTKGSLL